MEMSIGEWHNWSPYVFTKFDLWGDWFYPWSCSLASTSTSVHRTAWEVGGQGPSWGPFLETILWTPRLIFQESFKMTVPHFMGLLLCRCVFLRHIYDSWCVPVWINFSDGFLWATESQNCVCQQLPGVCYKFRFLGLNTSRSDPGHHWASFWEITTLANVIEKERFPLDFSF